MHGEDRDRSGRPFPWAERSPGRKRVMYGNDYDRPCPAGWYEPGGRIQFGHRMDEVPRVERVPSPYHRARENITIEGSDNSSGKRTSFVPNNSSTFDCEKEVSVRHRVIIESPQRAIIENSPTTRIILEGCSPVRVTRQSSPTVFTERPMRSTRENTPTKCREDLEDDNDNENAATVLAFVVVLVILGLFWHYA